MKTEYYVKISNLYEIICEETLKTIITLHQYNVAQIPKGLVYI